MQQVSNRRYVDSGCARHRNQPISTICSVRSSASILSQVCNRLYLLYRKLVSPSPRLNHIWSSNPWFLQKHVYPTSAAVVKSIHLGLYQQNDIDRSHAHHQRPHPFRTCSVRWSAAFPKSATIPIQQAVGLPESLSNHTCVHS